MMSSARAGLLALLSAVAGVVVIVFLGLYMAIDPARYREGLLRLFPPRRRPRINEVLIEVGDTLWAWTLGRLAAMALIAIGSTAGLWMIGIPLPVTLGVIAGLLNSVPNLGPLIASIPPLLFGLQQGGNAALYVAAFYLALQVIESYLITPLIDQQQVRLPPALTLAAQLLLGMLAGFMGLLLATPLVAAAHVLVRELYVKDMLERGVEVRFHESTES
jgi:predicted PurR-regulated permease PerM